MGSANGAALDSCVRGDRTHPGAAVTQVITPGARGCRDVQALDGFADGEDGHDAPFTLVLARRE